MVSNIRLATDQNQLLILVLLDLSAVFDIMHYYILVGRLANRLGIRGVVLQWLNSYLRSRTQTATLMDAVSVLAEILFGVRQGSVLSPLLYVMYMLPPTDVKRQHNVSMHSSADDAQLCVTFHHKDPPSVSAAVKSRMLYC